LITGLVECECNKYPVLDGILILREPFLNMGIVKLIEQRCIEEAIVRSLWIDYFEKIERYQLPVHSKLTWMLEKILIVLGKSQLKRRIKQLYKSYTDSEVTFFDLLGKGFVDTYFKQRFSSESFWSLYPFLPLFAEKKDRILDLACGVGHSSFVLERYVNPNQLFSTDFSFKNLFLAKKYFAPNAEFVCLDSTKTLPFKTGVFSSVSMLDAFYFIRSRTLAQEMKRVTSSTGLLLLLHVHNSLAFNLGNPLEALTPKNLFHLFEDKRFKTTLMPEKRVLENFLSNDELRLTEQHDQDELNSSNAMIILSTREEPAESIYRNVQSDFLKINDNLIINPIYKIVKKGNLILLQRPLGVSSFGDNLPTSEEFLPEEVEVHPTSLSGRRIEIADTEVLRKLQKKFVIINVPEKYV
jgi:SAM-dependent methyltransferase